MNDVSTEGLVGLWLSGAEQGRAGRDASGREHHGIVTGAIWGEHDGRHGLHFDGNGQSVDIPAAPGLEIERDIAIAAWIWKDRPNDGERWDAILSKTPGVWDYELLTSKARSDEPAFYSRPCEPNEVYAGSEVPARTWVHVAMTRRGAEVSFFVNGGLAGTSVMEGAFSRSGGVLQIGHDGAQANGGMHGWLSKVALYDRALDGDEVAALASS